MIQGLNDEELVHLVFDEQTIQELRWEHSREFEYRGEMYDVVRTQEMEGEVHFWCWHDHEESSLNRRLAESVNIAWGNNPHRDQQRDRLSLFLKALFFALPVGCEEIPSEQVQAAFLDLNLGNGLRFGPDGPPPRL